MTTFAPKANVLEPACCIGGLGAVSELRGSTAPRSASQP